MARLYVGNLAYDLTDDDLFDTFRAFNPSWAKVNRDPNGRSRGFGFVEIEDGTSAIAIAQLDGTDLHGRRLKVAVANPKRRPDAAA